MRKLLMVTVFALYYTAAFADIESVTTIKFYDFSGNVIRTETLKTKVEISWTDALMAAYKTYEGLKQLIAGAVSGNVLTATVGGIQTYNGINDLEESLSDKQGFGVIHLVADVTQYSKIEIIYSVKAGDPLRFVRVTRSKSDLITYPPDYENPREEGTDRYTMKVEVDLRKRRLIQPERYLVVFASAETDCNTCGFLGDNVDITLIPDLSGLTYYQRLFYQDLVAKYNGQRQSLENEKAKFADMVSLATQANVSRFLQEGGACPSVPREILDYCIARHSRPVDPCLRVAYDRYCGIEPAYIFGINDRAVLDKIRAQDALVKGKTLQLIVYQEQIEHMLRGITESLKLRTDISFCYWDKHNQEFPTVLKTDSLIYYPPIPGGQSESGSYINMKTFSLAPDASGSFDVEGKKCNYIWMNYSIISGREATASRYYIVQTPFAFSQTPFSRQNFMDNHQQFWTAEGILNLQYGFFPGQEVSPQFQHVFSIYSRRAPVGYEYSKVLFNPTRDPDWSLEEWRFTNSYLFNFQPTITGFSPATGNYGDIIRVTGNNFPGDLKLAIGDHVFKPFSVSAGEASFMVGDSTRSGKIKLLSRWGSMTSAAAFTRGDRPHIGRFYPLAAFPGDTVTILGSNLDKVSTLTVGGVPHVMIDRNFNSIRFRVTESTRTGVIVVRSGVMDANSSQSFQKKVRVNPGINRVIKNN